MLSDARRNLIKEMALRDGEVIISSVARELDVSLETIRRDINGLCRENVLEKVHGGAVPVKGNVYEDEYVKRKTANQGIKKELGRFVAETIKNSKTVFLSAGTTAEAIAGFANKLTAVSIITNSVPVAEALQKNGKSDIILLGGRINPEEHFTYGAQVISSIENYRVDVAVISAVGIDESGAMCASAEEGAIMAAMIKSASKSILVADSSKFGKKSVYRHCNPSQINQLVSDSSTAISESILKHYKRNMVKIDII